MAVRMVRSSAALAAGTVTALGLLTACGSEAASLVPYEHHGVPVATAAGVTIRPGQIADFDVYIVNKTDHPVEVVAASLAAAPGYRRPQLTHLGLEHGKNVIGSQRNWPPANLTVTPIIGATLPTGRSTLAVGVTARELGAFRVTAGVRLTYRDAGKTGHANAWGGSVVCVVPRLRERCSNHRYQAVGDRLTDYIDSR